MNLVSLWRMHKSAKEWDMNECDSSYLEPQFSNFSKFPFFVIYFIQLHADSTCKISASSFHNLFEQLILRVKPLLRTSSSTTKKTENLLQIPSWRPCIYYIFTDSYESPPHVQFSNACLTKETSTIEGSWWNCWKFRKQFKTRKYYSLSLNKNRR